MALPPHWQPVAAIFAALGDETRQRILLLFDEGEELSIKDIAAQFDLGRSTVVHHLAMLEKADILDARRAGKHAFYSVRPGSILDALDKLRLYIEETPPAAYHKPRTHQP
ncbi:MAG: metalloregulator ArsR/SmtB family transcription factor [Deltaproteobacteria bacterium]|nr:metalloregulator ArsR/SmtB family transcription factor [Deltaproteobacteria bacterium]